MLQALLGWILLSYQGPGPGSGKHSSVPRSDPSGCTLPSSFAAHVIAKAKGLAILSVIKAGFLVTARGGSGIVLARLPDGSKSAALHREERRAPLRACVPFPLWAASQEGGRLCVSTGTASLGRLPGCFLLAGQPGNLSEHQKVRPGLYIFSRPFVEQILNVDIIFLLSNMHSYSSALGYCLLMFYGSW